MNRKIFRSDEINRLMAAIDAALTGKVELLLIGGGAMSARGEKTATKDIDIVFTRKRELELFLRALSRLGFNELEDPGRVYRKMATRIFVDLEGHWLDIFFKRICKMFLVHKDVLERAEEYLRLEHLKVLLMSREDIFITKSVTEREGDLEDMYTLYTRGLDERSLIDEVAYQAAHSNRIWESFLVVRMDELERKFDVTVGFKNRLERRAVRKMEKLARKDE